jgi:hypothetical protein
VFGAENLWLHGTHLAPEQDQLLRPVSP